MKKLLILVFIVGTMVYGKTEKVIKYYHYKGNISKYEIQMSFEIVDNNFVKGYYYYEKYKKPIAIDGTIKSNKIELKENENIFTGVVEENKVTGIWKGKKEYKFELIENYDNSANSELIEKIKVFPYYEETNDEYSEEHGGNANTIKSEEIIFNDVNILVTLSYDYFCVIRAMAHGMGYANYTVYDLANEKEVKLYDVINKKYEKYFIKLIKDKLRSTTEKYYEDEKIYLTENFYLNTQGIGFLYNIYEIGPYISGDFDVFIPFSEIDKKVFKKSNLISRIIK